MSLFFTCYNFKLTFFSLLLVSKIKTFLAVLSKLLDAKMPASLKSSVVDSPKPSNVFYVWYTELCRRINANPLSIVRPAKPKNEAVLDFVSDRIKTEEWTPILNALRLDTSLHVIAIRSRIQSKFLYDVDTEEKARVMKRKFGSLWTAHVLSNLLKSLSACIRRSLVISCLELDGLPIGAEYLEPLLEALKKNKSLKILSFTHCPIRDNGCQQICMCLRFMPNVEILNVSGCSLTTLSAEYVSKLIRHQQINRYCESWHSSLRYEDPEVGVMAGLKRITLNNNPGLGDEGLGLILDELDDDLWIKAIDMQRCNITENMSARLIDAIDYSRSLEVADFRHNDLLSSQTIEKLFSILKEKQRLGYESQFQWCLTTTSLAYSVRETFSATSYISSKIQKSKSAPFKPTDVSKRFSFPHVPLRRTKTFALLPKKSPKNCLEITDLNDARKEVMQLNTQLKQEITKRIESEKANEELKRKLNEIVTFNSLDDDKIDFLDKHAAMPKIRDVKKKLELTIPVNEKIDRKKPVEFVFTNDHKIAQNLLENLLYKETGIEDEDEEELRYYYDDDFDIPKRDQMETDEDLSSSSVSLLRYVQEIKKSTEAQCIVDSKEAVVIDTTSRQCGIEENCSGRKKENNFQKVLVKVPPIR